MIFLQSGYRSLNSLSLLWFTFFNILKLEFFPSTISDHSSLPFSAVTLAKQSKEVSTIPGFSLNRLSESSSWLSERNADCLPTGHQDATQWQSIALGLWNEGPQTLSEYNWIDLQRKHITPGPLLLLLSCLWDTALLYVGSLISDTKHPFLRCCALAKLR